ncbi:MAG: DUF5694 domain-containing protein [Pseudomonadota bacterium]
MTVSTAVAAQTPADPVDPPATEVMVLGTYHFANPGRDVANVDVDDVLAPERQEEIAALTDALATWAPDRILIESQAPAPFAVADYRDFTPDMLAERRNESVQIGYRLAAQLGHDDVYGFDEQPADGEPDYFPYSTVSDYAAANGQEAEFGAISERVQSYANRLSADQQDKTIAQSLMIHNDPAVATAAQGDFYYSLLAIGDGEAQPGADLNAMYYLRNAKMFAKLGLIAQSGERILVIVGSGHKFWLDHFTDVSAGYRSVDPRPYLETAE